MENENHKPIAFMGIEDKKLEMLFIKNNEKRKRTRKAIIELWYRKL